MRARPATLLSLALLGTNALAYAVTVASARLLAPEAFGELSALLGVLLIGVVPAVGVQTAAALALGAAAMRDPGAAVRSVHATAVGAAGAVGVGALLLAAPVGALLHVTDPAALLWLAALLVPHTVAGGYDGILQGTGRHGRLAAVLATFGVAKLAGALAGLLLGGTPVAVLAGMTAGATAGAVLGWWACGRPGFGPGGAGLSRSAAAAAAALLGFVLLSNLDLLLARHVLPAVEAGHYAVGSIVFKIAFWLPQGVTLVLVPRLGDRGAGPRVLRSGLALLVASGTAVALGTLVAAPLLPLLLGPATPGDVWRFAVLGGVTALAQVLLYSGIATSDRRVPVTVWLAVAVECVLVTGLAGAGVRSLDLLVTVAIAVVLVVAAVGATTLRRGRTSPSKVA